ncbi:LacI family DNA-binding transcriptional regulator [Paenibacillus hunanensis]|uniref:LacI family transcriptional regulator n=1 Tax=Paenibacillus hunanensis TaxID=539262 RepID=A0ABU1J3A6_9BACL|nr:LacI family DNA-binding transcriptional regulator [Paenibacillus hunanensis]MCL9659602.1 LacI family transcriptional regulator [Paenibacillus hunanensis]MDR6244958.1 LacI family transcriptional regulator [Paenibacillus hunanensis]GGI95596.1 LacI family transcriptional regulator [Paenibacillus hunanensis]
MTVKIKDVARRAGVSVTSVSRVLNGEKYVSEDILNRVNQAIEELNYSPSYIARSLKKQKTNTIGVIVPDLTSNFYSTILSSIEEAASKYGYNLIVCNIAENLGKELKYLHIFQEMRVEGIIIMHEKTNEDIVNFIRNATMPILFSSVQSPDADFISVLIDDYQAAYDATEYLIRSGHTAISYLGGDLEDVTSGQNRYNGFRDALRKHDITIPEEYVKFGDYKLPSGHRLMGELLALAQPPTVVFAASDDMAVGALNCVLDQGLRVPEDVSIMGFDGSTITDIVRPSITSMQQPIYEMGQVSLENLHRLIIRDKQRPQADIMLQHQLVVRESCKTMHPSTSL